MLVLLELITAEIRTVGLFRVSADNEKVEKLQKQFDSGDIPTLSGAEVEHLACNILKSYLRYKYR